MSQLTIELGRDDRNMDVWVPPLNKALMGRWSKNNLPRADLGDTRAMKTPNIPGWRIAIDLRQKRVRVFHPWYRSEAGDRAAREFMERRGQPLLVAPPIVQEELDDLTLAKWLKWAWRVTHDKPEHCLASVFDGEFPKGVEAEVKKDRQFALNLATAHEQMANERALAMANAQAAAEVGGK